MADARIYEVTTCILLLGEDQTLDFSDVARIQVSHRQLSTYIFLRGLLLYTKISPHDKQFTSKYFIKL
jgi:hypothetical protein